MRDEYEKVRYTILKRVGNVLGEFGANWTHLGVMNRQSRTCKTWFGIIQIFCSSPVFYRIRRPQSLWPTPVNHVSRLVLSCCVWNLTCQSMRNIQSWRSTSLSLAHKVAVKACRLWMNPRLCMLTLFLGWFAFQCFASTVELTFIVLLLTFQAPHQLKT